MITIWGRRNSFNVQKVMWLLHELNIEYERIDVGGRFGGLNTPEYLEMNPHGRIPVIKDGDWVVWESHAILRYLAAKSGNKQFWSDDVKARSIADRWMDWAQSTLQPDFLTGVFWGFYRTPEEQRNWDAINESIIRCTEHFQLLDNILRQQRYLGGDELSLADFPAGAILYRYFELEIPRPKVPHVEEWYKRLQERPAYREHVMVAFDEMKGRLTF